MSAALVHAWPVGTDAWRNWRGFAGGSAERENFDDELQSDVSFIGETDAFGPYRLSTVVRDSDAVGPAVIVRGGIHADLMPVVVADGQLARSDSRAYHGGNMSDEIAALISLALGVRIRLAGTLRLSLLHDDQDPGPRSISRFPA